MDFKVEAFLRKAIENKKILKPHAVIDRSKEINEGEQIIVLLSDQIYSIQARVSKKKWNERLCEFPESRDSLVHIILLSDYSILYEKQNFKLYINDFLFLSETKKRPLPLNINKANDLLGLKDFLDIKWGVSYLTRNQPVEKENIERRFLRVFRRYEAACRRKNFNVEKNTNTLKFLQLFDMCNVAKEEINKELSFSCSSLDNNKNRMKANEIIAEEIDSLFESNIFTPHTMEINYEKPLKKSANNKKEGKISVRKLKANLQARTKNGRFTKSKTSITNVPTNRCNTSILDIIDSCSDMDDRNYMKCILIPPRNGSKKNKTGNSKGGARKRVDYEKITRKSARKLCVKKKRM